MPLPLTGMKVLDLSNVLAGPFCGYHLARLGAEVVKVERPEGGDLARRLGADEDLARREFGLTFIAVNADKQSLALDLKSARGKEIFLRLVEDVDVVLENFRPGVMERLGLDYQVLKSRNPRLIYCAISGFGQEGPWAGRPAYDQIIQGLSGAMSVTGTPEIGPLRAGFPLADMIAGLNAAMAILAALAGDPRLRESRFIDVSLLDCTIASMGWAVTSFLNAGVVPGPQGNENTSAAPSGAFKAADGLINISANEQKQFLSLCELIGRPDLPHDPRFKDGHARKRHRDALNRAIEDRLAARPAAEWEILLNDNGVPAGRVLTVPEILEEQQIVSRKLVETLGVSNKDGQPLRIMRPGFRFDEDYPQPSDPRQLGADTATWLARIGFTGDEIAALTQAGTVKCAGPVPIRETARGA